MASAGGQEVKLWDADKGVEIRSFKGNKWPVVSVAISANGKRIVSASSAGPRRKLTNPSPA